MVSGCFPQPVCKVNLIRGLFCKPLVRSVLIKSMEVSGQTLSKLSNRVVRVQVDMFILHRTPKPFDEHVIHPAALAIHTDLNAVGLQDAGESLAGELAALISVKDLGFAVAGDCLPPASELLSLE